MSGSPRREVRVAARTVTTAAAILVVAALTIAATVYAPVSRSGTHVPADDVRVPAADYVTSCPGPIGTADSEDAGSELSFTNDTNDTNDQWLDAVSAPAGFLQPDPAPASAFSADELTLDGEGKTITRAEPGDHGTVKTGKELTSAFGITGKVAHDNPADVQAAQISRAKKGELRGLAASTCTGLGSDFWIVGGSTEVGRSARLVLTNPTEKSATVSVAVYGKDGRIKTTGGQDLLVGAGSQRSVLLEGLAQDDGHVAVHVTGTGGLFSAAVQHNVMRGLQPGGVDYLTPSATPSKTQRVPGISIATSAPDTKAYADGHPALRIVNTGPNTAHVEIRIFGPDGVAKFTKSKATVKSQGVTDVPLTSLPKGNYSASITADAPITAAARSIRQGGSGKHSPADFAWSPSAEPLSGGQLATIPSGVNSVLDLTAVDGNGSVTVRALQQDGTLSKKKTIRLGAGITKTLDPEKLGQDPAAVLMQPADDSADVVAATVLTADVAHGTGISTLKVPAAPPGGSSKTIRIPR